MSSVVSIKTDNFVNTLKDYTVIGSYPMYTSYAYANTSGSNNVCYVPFPFTQQYTPQLVMDTQSNKDIYPDIYIPCVLSNVTEDNIKKTFIDSSICIIDSVDFVKEEHKKYRCAVMKVLSWFDNDYANHIRSFLINNDRKQYDFVYDFNKNLKWFLYKSTAIKNDDVDE